MEAIVAVPTARNSEQSIGSYDTHDPTFTSCRKLPWTYARAASVGNGGSVPPL